MPGGKMMDGNKDRTEVRVHGLIPSGGTDQVNPAPQTGTNKHVGRHPQAKQIKQIKATAEKGKANKKKHLKPKLRQHHRQKLQQKAEQIHPEYRIGQRCVNGVTEL